MVKKKRHKAFWSNIKFKYKLTIINENTLEEVVGLRVSKLNGISPFRLQHNRHRRLLQFGGKR